MSDLPLNFEIARIGEHDGNAHAFEASFQDFEFAPGRNFAPIDDGHLRPLVGAAPIDVAGDERVEKFGAERIAVDFEGAENSSKIGSWRKTSASVSVYPAPAGASPLYSANLSESGSRKASRRDEVLARP